MVLKRFPQLNIMHLSEENGKSETVKEYDNKRVEDIDSDEEANVDPEENIEILDGLEESSSYFIHEKVFKDNHNNSKKCSIHKDSDGYCERTKMLI